MCIITASSESSLKLPTFAGSGGDAASSVSGASPSASSLRGSALNAVPQGFVAVGAQMGILLACAALEVAASIITRVAAKAAQASGAIAIASARKARRLAIGRLSCVSPTPGYVQTCAVTGTCRGFYWSGTEDGWVTGWYLLCSHAGSRDVRLGLRRRALRAPANG